MYDNYIRGKKGFGIITLMIIAMFAAVAATSMFVSAVYIRSKANENYHRRKALLELRNQFEIVQLNWHRRGVISNDMNGQTNLQRTSVTLDVYNGRPLTGTITWNRPAGQVIIDPLVATNAAYAKVEGTLSWDEPQIFKERFNRKKTVKVMLREDFYFRAQSGQSDDGGQ